MTRIARSDTRSLDAVVQRALARPLDLLVTRVVVPEARRAALARATSVRVGATPFVGTRLSGCGRTALIQRLRARVGAVAAHGIHDVVTLGIGNFYRFGVGAVVGRAARIGHKFARTRAGAIVKIANSLLGHVQRVAVPSRARVRCTLVPPTVIFTRDEQRLSSNRVDFFRAQRGCQTICFAWQHNIRPGNTCVFTMADPLELPDRAVVLPQLRTKARARARRCGLIRHFWKLVDGVVVVARHPRLPR